MIRGEQYEKFLGRKYRRHQALRARRRRSDDPRARGGDQVRRPARGQGNRLRHGAPRPAQRARQRHGQALQGDLPRILRRLGQSRGRRRLGRRQVPPRHLDRPRVRRDQGAHEPGAQPLPPRGGRSGRAGQGARAAGLPRRHRPEQVQAGAAGADPRRRGLRRAGHRLGVPRLLGRPRLRHRRLHPFHHQQPDRLHHLPAVLARTRPIPRTSPRASRRRSSTSTATIPKR